MSQKQFFHTLRKYRKTFAGAKVQQKNDMCKETPRKKEQAPYEAAKKEQAYTPPIPREGDYNGVRLYIEERKKYDEQFNDYCLRHNRKELCSFLTKEFGWFVDDKSLGRNIQRNI